VTRLLGAQRERESCKFFFLIKLFSDLIITKSLLNDTKKEGKKRKNFFLAWHQDLWT
jgi:hypothetical protein